MTRYRTGYLPSGACYLIKDRIESSDQKMTKKIETGSAGVSADQHPADHQKLVPIGTKVPKDTHDRLRWLAYMKDTTVSAIVAEYIASCIQGEDFSRYQPPDQ